MNKYKELADSVALARVQLQKDKDFGAVLKRLDDIEKEVSLLSDKDNIFKEELVKNLQALLYNEKTSLAKELADLKSQNAVLADALQKLTRQVHLMEKNYNIIETIGGK